MRVYLQCHQCRFQHEKNSICALANSSKVFIWIQGKFVEKKPHVYLNGMLLLLYYGIVLFFYLFQFNSTWQNYNIFERVGKLFFFRLLLLVFAHFSIWKLRKIMNQSILLIRLRCWSKQCFVDRRVEISTRVSLNYRLKFKLRLEVHTINNLFPN